MHDLIHLEPVDYLVIGHIATDLTPDGPRLGGSAAYGALTARALGLRVGIVTALRADTDLTPLAGVPVVAIPSAQNSTFENRAGADGRRQTLHQSAASLSLEHVPSLWRTASIIHLAPIADELDADMAAGLRPSLLGVTPQGWMRQWDDRGVVRARPWLNAADILPHAGAVVLSMEDAGHDLESIERLAQQARVLCVTEGAAGSVVYWHGDRRHLPAPPITAVDSTGAGDIFAAAFFTRLLSTRDPWEAARFATQLAARSVARPGLQGIPTTAEIEDCLMEVLS
jgi:sugar/nucleoside kinase (ribokinase family)